MIEPQPSPVRVASRSTSTPATWRPIARARGASLARVLVIVVGVAALAGIGYYYYHSRSAGETAGADGAPRDGAPKDGGGKGSGKGGAGKGARFGAGGPAPVSAITAVKDNLNIRLIALGTVTARNTVTVRSRVDGPLLRVLFKEGQLVKAGDLLAEIDPLPLQAALTQSAGNLARDQALLQNAQIDLERYKSLMSTDSIPKQTLDTQAATVRQYEGIVATDRGAVEAARLQLSYTKIYAPLTGQVGLRLVDPGNIVHASDSTGLVSITELDPITVVSAIPEVSVQQLLKRIHEGGDVLVEAWDSGMKSMIARGKLLSTDNQIDTATGTLKLKAEFPNSNRALFPNQFVNVRVLIGQDTGATVINQSAVQRGAQGTYVYLVNPDSTVTVRVVKLGTTDGDRVGVVSGLNPGDRVVSDGADKLREGAKVEVIDRATAAAAGETPAEGKGGARKGGGNGEHKGRRGKGGDGSGVPGGTGAPGAPGAETNAPPGTGGQDRPANPGGNPAGAGNNGGTNDGKSGGGSSAAPSPGAGA